ncbi:protein of unknown function DUF180 [Clostridium cellulovorans 743B]|uniref:Flagellar assembly factor FliW n=2 Tax=Clostridium cellulovorans TaxID=1493 RepID=D9SKF1_CLOC7|nr:protein of unknown function DUF180 [Clostridium cellulovorans 743B]
MMKYNTKYHGEIEYNEEQVVVFQKGLPGFESLRKFVMLPVEDNPNFKILHSIEDNEVGLICVSPFDINSDYEVELEQSTIDNLKIENPKDVFILSFVTLASKVENITVNLAAPVIINNNNRLGEQIILNNEKYKIKYPLLKR